MSKIDKYKVIVLEVLFLCSKPTHSAEVGKAHYIIQPTNSMEPVLDDLYLAWAQDGKRA